MLADELALEEGEKFSRVKNVRYSTYPVVLHGNGASKVILSYCQDCLMFLHAILI